MRHPQRRVALLAAIPLAMGMAAGQALDVSAQVAPDHVLDRYGSFEEDWSTPSRGMGDAVLQVLRLSEKWVAMQAARPPTADDDRTLPVAQVGDTMLVLQSTGAHSRMVVRERGYLQPVDWCSVPVAGWAYLLEPEGEHWEAGADPHRSAGFVGTAMAVSPRFEPGRLEPMEPDRALRIFPALLEDMEERGRQLRMRAQRPGSGGRDVDSLIGDMLGGAEARLAALQPFIGQGSFEGLRGRVNLISIPGFDDPYEHTLGTWFTYLFADDGAVLHRSRGAHFPRAVVIDPEVGNEVMITTTGMLHHRDGEWLLPAGDEPQRCT